MQHQLGLVGPPLEFELREWERPFLQRAWSWSHGGFDHGFHHCGWSLDNGSWWMDAAVVKQRPGAETGWQTHEEAVFVGRYG